VLGLIEKRMKSRSGQAVNADPQAAAGAEKR
jgi:hypothetical protein